MEVCKNAEDAKTSNNNAMSCVEVGLKKMLNKVVEICKFNNEPLFIVFKLVQASIIQSKMCMRL